MFKRNALFFVLYLLVFNLTGAVSTNTALPSTSNEIVQKENSHKKKKRLKKFFRKMASFVVSPPSDGIRSGKVISVLSSIGILYFIVLSTVLSGTLGGFLFLSVGFLMSLMMGILLLKQVKTRHLIRIGRIAIILSILGLVLFSLWGIVGFSVAGHLPGWFFFGYLGFVLSLISGIKLRRKGKRQRKHERKNI